MVALLWALCSLTLLRPCSGSPRMPLQAFTLPRNPTCGFKLQRLHTSALLSKWEQRRRNHPVKLRGGSELEIVSAHGRADGDDEFRLSFISVTRRASLLLLLFLLPLGTILPAALFGSFREKLWFSMLGWSIGHSGAAFIKWGQWASVRPDMFPEGLCKVLSR